MIRLSLLGLVGLAWPLVAQPIAVAQSTSSDPIVLTLPSLMSVAFKSSIDLRLATLGPTMAAADQRAARARFDPTLMLAAEGGKAAQEMFGVAPQATQATARTSATASRVFPVGAQLALSLFDARSALDPYAIQGTSSGAAWRSSGVGASLTQPLLRGFGRSGTYGLVDAASDVAEAARHRFDRNADLIVGAIERAYWALRQSEGNETVVGQSLAAARAIYDRNLALRARDLATALDVLTAERGLATRETQLSEATRLRVDAADRLLFLVYGEEARDSTVSRSERVHTSADSALVPDVPRLEEAEQLAFASRSDLVAATREVAASRHRATQAQSGLRPLLDLVASYRYGGAGPTSRLLVYRDSGNLGTSDWTVGFSASLFQHNDAARSTDERAAADLYGAQLALAATENAVRADVRAAVRAMQTGRQRFLRAGDVVRLAEQEYKAASDGARLGLVSTFQLLQYEAELALARLLLAEARFALEDAGTQYRIATGVAGQAYGWPRSRPDSH